ncbi:hypothetical protein BCJMU39_p1220 (plasmid) [Bacillus cereus]|uniref:SIR2 family protein n=1 Tax=Bacillus cereus TaxID=1396 RepID=UPI001F166917|nr:SIR2 family protein [Bacillus cereus]BCC68194.1 hypothetical protein BCJMU39_p1220 [Bacillus cereus]
MNTKVKIKLDSIQEIPDINNYPEILEAAKLGNLIIFVGAGVSKLVDLPLWNQFAQDRLNTIYYDENLIDYRTYEGLKKLDAKKLLTICEILMKEKQIKPKPAEQVFAIQDYEKYQNVYSKLYSMNAIYITTNYDECLDRIAKEVENSRKLDEDINTNVNSKSLQSELSREIVFERSDILESKLKNGNVIHIHGSIKQEKDMLVTLNHYLECYGANSENTFPELSVFLDKVFNSKYVVLFMGYGLEEYEILEYMLSKNTNPEYKKKHYMLYPTYKEDYKMVELLNKYYNNLGVELISFDISRNGFSQLIPIIHEWADVLSEVSKEQDYMQNIQLIKDVIKREEQKAFRAGIRAVIDLIEKDESLGDYLFENVDDERWFDYLKEKGFFNPEKVPSPEKEGDNYQVRYWSQTDYLKKVVQHESRINDILQIINKISNYEDEKGESLDNYLVWSEFIEILTNIPNEYLDLKVINVIEKWMNSKYGEERISFEVGKKLLPKFINSKEPKDIEMAENIIMLLLKLDCEHNLIKLKSYHFYNIFNENMVNIISKVCSEELLIYIKEQINRFLGDSESNVVFTCDDKQYAIKVFNFAEKYSIKILDESKFIYEFDLEQVELEEFVERVANFISNKFEGKKIESDLKNKIRFVYYGLYNKEVFYSLHDSNEKGNQDGIELILNLLKRLLVSKEDSFIEKFLSNLMNEEYFLFQKILLYVIGKNSPMYNRIFWNILSCEKGKIIFQEGAFEDELRVVLEKLENIELHNQEILMDYIEKGPDLYWEIENEEKYKEIWKMKRLNTLKEIPYFNEQYRKLKAKNDIDVKMGPMIKTEKIKIDSKSVSIDEEQLLKMTNNELAAYINEFKVTNFWEGPTTNDLGRVIKEFTKKHPNKIVENLQPFINTKYDYICQILLGLIDSWKEKKSFDWGKILEFILSYINRIEFWSDNYKIDDGVYYADYKSTLKCIFPY